MTAVGDWLRVTDEQRKVLSILHAIFLRDGNWPVHAYLEQQLDREEVELNDELATMPARFLSPDRRGPGGPGYYQENDQMKLLLPGAAALDRSSNEVRMFIAVIHWAIEQRRNLPIEPQGIPEARWDAADAIRSMESAVGTPLSAFQAKLVLDMTMEEFQLPNWAGVWERFPEWTLDIPREIRRFRDVRTIEDYLAATMPSVARGLGALSLDIPAAAAAPPADAEDESVIGASVTMSQRIGDQRTEPTSRMPSAFISYAHEDQAFVQELVRQLLAHQLDIRYDQIVLRVGDSVIRRISDAIAEGDFLIAVVSPDSIASEWCRTELSLARTDGIGNRRVKVLPVRIRRAEMPAMLRDAYWADGDRMAVDALASKLAESIASHAADTAGEVDTVATHERAVAAESALQLPDLDAVAECSLDVLAHWSRFGPDGPTPDLGDSQRRLRFALDALPEADAAALPIATALGHETWERYFSVRSAGEVENDLREEFRAIRAQFSQGVPRAPRWSIDEGPTHVSVGNRDAIAFLWVIARGRERRAVRVLISRSAEASIDDALPAEVAAAKSSRGRSVAAMLIALDDPPESALVTTAGITWPIPDD